MSLLYCLIVQPVIYIGAQVKNVCDLNKSSTGYYGDYGCNCIGDLDRSGIGGGPTLDLLDKVNPNLDCLRFCENFITTIS